MVDPFLQVALKRVEADGRHLQVVLSIQGTPLKALLIPARDYYASLPKKQEPDVAAAIAADEAGRYVHLREVDFGHTKALFFRVQIESVDGFWFGK